MNLIIAALFVSTIPAANWLISNFGENCSPDSPCLIPVGFGLMAPSGVLMAGAALVLRDIIQESSGVPATLAAILAGVMISAMFSPPPLIAASAAAFLFAELADMAIYTPLRKRQLAFAVITSGSVGAVVDSAIFLFVAFGNLDFVAGHTVGKIWMSALAAGAIILMRKLKTI